MKGFVRIVNTHLFERVLREELEPENVQHPYAYLVNETDHFCIYLRRGEWRGGEGRGGEEGEKRGMGYDGDIENRMYRGF